MMANPPIPGEPAPVPSGVGAAPPLYVVDTQAIRTNLQARMSYLVSFIGFSDSDVEALRMAAPLIRPYIAGIVESMCE